MPIQILPKDESLSEVLGSSLGGLGGSAISNYLRKKAQERAFEQQQKLQEQGFKQKQELQREKLGVDALKEQLKQQKLQEKEQRLQEQEQEELQTAADDLRELYSLYNSINAFDPYSPWANLQSKASKLYRDKAATLRSNKTLKKLGITIPKLDAASEEVFEDAFKRLGMVPLQEVQQQQERQPQNVPIRRERQQSLPEQGQQALSSLEGLPGLLGGILSSGVAGAAGLPSRITDLLSGIAGAGKSLASGLVPEELREQYEQTQTPVQRALGAAQQVLPTREGLEKRLPFAPEEGESEEIKSAREFAGDLGENLAFTLATGGVGSAKSIASLLKRAGIVEGAGNLAKYMTKKLKFSPAAQDSFKLGTTLLTSFGMGPSLKEAAHDTYAKQIESMPENVLLTYQKNPKVMDKVHQAATYFNRLESGFGPSSELLERMFSDRVSYKDAFKFLNELQLKDFSNQTSREFVKGLREVLKSAVKESAILPKESVKLLNDADQLWRGVKESEDAVRFISEIPLISKYAKSKKGLFGLGLLALAGGPKTQALGTLAGTSAAVNKLRVALKNYFTKPAVRNAYTKMMGAALKRSAPAVVRYAKQLDKEIKEAKK